MILIDVNIFMDVLEQRTGWEASLKLLMNVRKGKQQACICALTVSVLYFLRSKFYTEEQSRNDVREITRGFEIVGLDKNILDKAFTIDFPDFEDAIQYFSALEHKCTAIVTRNGKDFRSSAIRVVTPEEMI